MLEDRDFLVPLGSARTVWDGDLYQSMPQSPSPDSTRNLVARLIAALTAEPARSAPPTLDEGAEYPFPPQGVVMGQESLDELRDQYISRSDAQLCIQNSPWTKAICSHRMAFLSHVSVACVYQDLEEGFLDDTALTVYAKTKVLGMITESLRHHTTQTDDFTILIILHLLTSEIGGQNEERIDVHQEGLMRIVHQRGGLSNLGWDGSIATFLTVVILTFTVLRGRPEPPMLHGFVPSRITSANVGLAISPLYAPNNDMSPLYGKCSKRTHDIISDMHDLTRTFVARWTFAIEAPQFASFDNHMQQIYTRLLLRTTTENDAAPDWKYESCRLAALVYCGAMVQGMSLSESATAIHAPGSSASQEGTAIITALHNAVEQTDSSTFWDDMCGVLFWICLVGGAASRPHDQFSNEARQDKHTQAAWTRKSFALHAVRTSFPRGFENSKAIVESQRTMLQVQHLIDVKSGLLPR
ncbi:hypothetical protein CC80DRAFT_400285 [Byssothecium circinans]|uniref:Transcription factor domain-containing protein n=1 Tax=Byssothecium circinans TaxID=147558 RepID=A0A6A5UC06_9PLEO|nr:hypothetical protein CC80DRAFT_400285 [Byssothecium circinans]